MSDPLGLWPAFRKALVAARGRAGAAEFLEFAARVLRKEAEIAKPREAQSTRPYEGLFQGRGR